MLANLAGIVLLPVTARGDIYLTNYDSYNGKVAQYTNLGTLVNPSLISGLSLPYGVAVSGSDIFVAENGRQRIGKYTISGATANASLINFVDPIGLTLYGSNLYVANTGQIPNSDWVSVYTTSGTAVNGQGVSGLANGSWSAAVSGSNLFVTNNYNGTVGEYTTSGATVNGSLISGLSGPWGIAVSGSDLYVANGWTGTIGKYTLGATPGTITSSTPSLISGLTGPHGIVVSGSYLFVLNNGSVGLYTTSGQTVNASLISGLNSLDGFAVTGVVVPEPASLTLLIVGAISLVVRRRNPATAGA